MKRLVVAAVLLLSVFSAMHVGAQSDQRSSREAPHPYGAAIDVGEYTMHVVDVTPDATAVILNTNRFNDRPALGNQFFMIRVEATYTGTGTGDAWHDLEFGIVGNRNLGYSTSNAGCGVVPDPGYDTPELFPNGTTQFDVCWSVPTEEVGSFVLYVEPDRASDDDRVWFSLDAEPSGTPPA